MRISLKLIKSRPNPKGECPVFVRIRDTNSKGKISEVSISTGIEVLPKHFSKGGLNTKTPNYTDKQRVVNSILDEIERIISETIENGLEPNPQFVKKEFELRTIIKEERTPQFQSFWKSFDEWMNTKKGKSRGYTKTLLTLKNRLTDFQNHRKISITFDYIVGKTILFQSEFENYCKYP